MNDSVPHFLRKNFYGIIVLTVIVIIYYCIWQKLNSNSNTNAIPKLDISNKIYTLSKRNLGGHKLIYGKIPSWLKVHDGIEIFHELNCPVKTCILTSNDFKRNISDLVLFNAQYTTTNEPRPPNQIYAMYYMESPPHSPTVLHPDAINWTITYRCDSTIPQPYQQWIYYNPEITQLKHTYNFAGKKSKKVAWFVSNCLANNDRLEYAHELQEYIQVDIYGECGTLACSVEDKEDCYDMLDTDYKFYLAFENSNCKDYITEKLFENTLRHNILPIVMGPTIEEYQKYAPLKSFIHVDEFESPAELAKYLHILDGNDDLYNLYFRYKGTGEVVYTPRRFLCDLCAMIHDDELLSHPQWYENINDWWRGPGICTTGSWRNHNRTQNAV